MSLNGSSLGFGDFLGINTRREDHGGDREEESIEEDAPVESIYREIFEETHREVHPAIHQCRQSMQDVPMGLNLSWYRFASPINVMSQGMFEPSITHDGVSAEMVPLNINDSLWAWDDQPEPGGSTPSFIDMAWSVGATTKNSMSYSPSRVTNSPRYVAIPSTDPHPPYPNSLARASRKTMV
jgi:hypothetical protein